MLPTQINGGLKTSEDEIIPLHPNAPAHNNDYIHKKCHIQLSSELI